MNRRTILILLVIFLALVAVLIWQSQPKPLAITVIEATEPSAFRLFPDMAVLDIQAIRIQDPNLEDHFTISRADDGTWTAPSQNGTLDAEAASTIARSVVLMSYQRALPITEETDLQEFGFRPRGVFFVAIVLANGDQHAVAVGELTASREEYYVLVDDREEVYLIERGPIDFLISQYVDPPIT